MDDETGPVDFDGNPIPSERIAVLLSNPVQRRSSILHFDVMIETLMSNLKADDYQGMRLAASLIEKKMKIVNSKDYNEQ